MALLAIAEGETNVFAEFPMLTRTAWTILLYLDSICETL